MPGKKPIQKRIAADRARQAKFVKDQKRAKKRRDAAATFKPPAVKKATQVAAKAPPPPPPPSPEEKRSVDKAIKSGASDAIAVALFDMTGESQRMDRLLASNIVERMHIGEALRSEIRKAAKKGKGDVVNIRIIERRLQMPANEVNVDLSATRRNARRYADKIKASAVSLITFIDTATDPKADGHYLIPCIEIIAFGPGVKDAAEQWRDNAKNGLSLRDGGCEVIIRPIERKAALQQVINQMFDYRPKKPASVKKPAVSRKERLLAQVKTLATQPLNAVLDGYNDGGLVKAEIHKAEQRLKKVKPVLDARRVLHSICEFNKQTLQGQWTLPFVKTR